MRLFTTLGIIREGLSRLYISKKCDSTIAHLRYFDRKQISNIENIAVTMSSMRSRSSAGVPSTKTASSHHHEPREASFKRKRGESRTICMMIAATAFGFLFAYIVMSLQEEPPPPRRSISSPLKSSLSTKSTIKSAISAKKQQARPDESFLIRKSPNDGATMELPEKSLAQLRPAQTTIETTPVKNGPTELFIRDLSHATSETTVPQLPKNMPTELRIRPRNMTVVAGAKTKTISGSIPNKPISANDNIHVNVKHVHREVRTDNAHIFYNVFINPEAPKRSTDIAREQMRQVANSTSLRNNKLYYNVIGENITDINVCDEQPILDCKRMNTYAEGNEELTLQELYDFCQSHPIDKVIYMHNKGSFRKERGNTKIRRLSTTAVVSHACLEMPLNDDYPCNVCGLTFQSKPYFHMTANHWVAECMYVRELLPPKVYTILRTDLLKRLWDEEPCLRHHAGEDLVWDLQNTSFLKLYGLGRYAMERWLFGHPSLIPCDVIPFRIARFKRGFEDWFEPTLRWSRHLIWDEAEESERREIWLLLHEFKQLYAHKKDLYPLEPNFALSNYTGNVKPSACLSS